MAEQLDLFVRCELADIPIGAGARLPRRPPVSALDDDAVIGALPSSNMAETLALATETGRRRLRAAVPVLERLCRRFVGFGIDRPVPEQVAALEALGEIGGREAANAAARLILKGIVQGPTLAVAVRVAGRLGARLPAATVARLLGDPDPQMRAAACRCAHPAPAVIARLNRLLDDPHDAVRASAACGLGRMGRIEARPALMALLAARPSPEVIEAAEPVADEACLVLLGRIARTVPALCDCAWQALASCDHPRAAAIIRTVAPPPGGRADAPTPTGTAPLGG
jgi:hypothetical protein